MAQAARQSLRLHKELKLLLTDPPPGASFPFLSPQSDPSLSLSSLLAEIKGPEGTVYEKGVFTLKIQIPERYPFQPPIVTFATPIYHPNIDNGGRICLDILNLPPKGAWQPSLNISTVLTSIGLLLSEPNPDDGLMCEASKEYKYNRHAFDQKARSMTEKFARAGAIGDGSCSKISQTQSSTVMVETKREIEEDFASNKMFIENASKLSSECIEPQQNKDINNGFNEKPFDKIERPKEICRQMVEEYHQHHKNLSWTKRKLSLGSLGPSEQKVDDKKETLKRKQILSSPNSLNVKPKEVNSHYNGRLLNRDDDVAMIHTPPLSPKDIADKTENNFNISSRKNLGLPSKRLSLGLSSSSQTQQTDNKENTNPELPFTYTNSLQLNKNRGAFVINVSKNMGETASSRVEHVHIAGNSEKQQEIERSILPDSVIVLDSEDSEEESNGSVRSRLLLARKRLPGNSKKEY